MTLDTTRADFIGPEAAGVNTPAFNRIAARGRLFTQAYAVAPETLPSHASMLTGLYPAGHGVHENGRHLAAGPALAAERLRTAGYRTAAFVSSFVLAKRFGLARGFETYDDELPNGLERSSVETTDRALAYLGRDGASPVFLWVHYFDPHTPYEPPEPFRTSAPSPYAGEIEAMDRQLGRLLDAFEARAGAAAAVLLVGDHGEGLGDHGEAQHGALVYQSTMRVPLAMAGPGVEPGSSGAPVSTRRVYHTVLDWARIDGAFSLRSGHDEVVLGEGMKPFLEYGWQPQTMAVHGTMKAILAGTLELYDLGRDPKETKNLVTSTVLPTAIRAALEDYPLPPAGSAAPEALDEDARRKLAALGYTSGRARPPVRSDAPRPADMVHLLDDIEKASALFTSGRYDDVLPVLEEILAADPGNLDATLRLAVARSMLGRRGAADEAFRRAVRLAPDSQDVQMYFALHQARGPDWQQALPRLERIVSESPERLPALEALARLRERQARIPDALALWVRVLEMRAPSAPELLHIGQLAMQAGRTQIALDVFERARAIQRARFRHDLELGVLYLAARRFAEARDALDRVPPSHPDYPMALFKRAQVSVLLNEPDKSDRIAAARRAADATTRELIAKERLF